MRLQAYSLTSSWAQPLVSTDLYTCVSVLCSLVVLSVASSLLCIAPWPGGSLMLDVCRLISLKHQLSGEFAQATVQHPHASHRRELCVMYACGISMKCISCLASAIHTSAVWWTPVLLYLPHMDPVSFIGWPTPAAC